MANEPTPVEKLRCRNCGEKPREDDRYVVDDRTHIDCSRCGADIEPIDFTVRNFEKIAERHREYYRNNPQEAATAPEPSLDDGPQVGDGEGIIEIDPLVEALFRGEIDKEEFHRRGEERDDDEDIQHNVYGPDDD